MLDRPLATCVEQAIAKLHGGMENAAPAAAASFVAWTERLSPTGRATDYFDGGRAIMFLLPWWLEKRIRPDPDPDLQSRIVESTINAYYAARLIDNLMDEDGADERTLLPLVAILHANVFHGYAALFPPGDAFWDHFGRHWHRTAETAVRERLTREISEQDFIEWVGQKTAGVKISLAAVCCRYRRMDLLEPWCAFYDYLACWQQMLGDTFDWLRDRRNGTSTFFLSEGARQKRDGESIAGWVVRRGFSWSVGWLSASMDRLRIQAESLESPELLRFLEYRDTEARDRAAGLTAQLTELAAVADVFETVTEPCLARGARIARPEG
jgi:hypothetical protein